MMAEHPPLGQVRVGSTLLLPCRMTAKSAAGVTLEPVDAAGTATGQLQIAATGEVTGAWTADPKNQPVRVVAFALTRRGGRPGDRHRRPGRGGGGQRRRQPEPLEPGPGRPPLLHHRRLAAHRRNGHASVNRPRNGRDYAGWAAVILACALGLSLVVTAVAVLIFDRDLTEAGGRLLTTIGAGLVGALSVYIGASRRHPPPPRGHLAS